MLLYEHTWRGMSEIIMKAKL